MRTRANSSGLAPPHMQIGQDQAPPSIHTLQLHTEAHDGDGEHDAEDGDLVVEEAVLEDRHQARLAHPVRCRAHVASQ